MGKFLDKMIKNSSDVQDVRVRAAYGTAAGIVGIGTNLVLFAVKLVIGILLSSMAVTADAVNNLSDAVSSGISFFRESFQNILHPKNLGFPRC